MYLFQNYVFVKTTFIYLMGLLFPNATFIYFLRLIHLIPPRPPFLVPLYSNFLFAGDIIQFNGKLPKSPAAKK